MSIALLAVFSAVVAYSFKPDNFSVLSNLNHLNKVSNGEYVRLFRGNETKFSVTKSGFVINKDIEANKEIAAVVIGDSLRDNIIPGLVNDPNVDAVYSYDLGLDALQHSHDLSAARKIAIGCWFKDEDEFNETHLDFLEVFDRNSDLVDDLKKCDQLYFAKRYKRLTDEIEVLLSNAKTKYLYLSFLFSFDNQEKRHPFDELVRNLQFELQVKRIEFLLGMLDQDVEIIFVSPLPNFAVKSPSVYSIGHRLHSKKQIQPQ